MISARQSSADGVLSGRLSWPISREVGRGAARYRPEVGPGLVQSGLIGDGFCQHARPAGSRGRRPEGATLRARTAPFASFTEEGGCVSRQLNRRRTSSEAVALVVLCLVGAAVALTAWWPASARAAVGGGTLRVRVSGLPSGQRPMGVLFGPGGRRRISVSRVKIRGARPGLYRLVLERVALSRSVGALTRGAVAYPARSVRVRLRAGKTATVAGAYWMIMNPGVIKLVAQVLSVRGDAANPVSIVLAGRERLRSGAVLSMAPSARLPRGLLAHVRFVSYTSGRTTVALAPASVYRVAPVAQFDIPLSVEKAASTRASSGGLVRSAGCGRADGVLPYRRITKIRFSGGWNTVPLLGRDTKIGIRTQVEFDAKLGLDVTRDVGASCSAGLSELAEGMVGPIPVTAAIYGQLRASAGSGSKLFSGGSLHAAVRATTVRSPTGLAWRPQVKFSRPSFAFMGSALTQADAGIGVSVKATLGNDGGATLAFSNRIEFAANPGSCSWDASFGHFSADGKLLGSTIEAPKTPALFTENLWHCGSSSGPAPVSITNPGTQIGAGQPQRVSVGGVSAGTTVSGTVPLSAVVRGFTADRVVFSIDGQFRSDTDGASPYRYTWYTAAEANGKHTVTVQAYPHGSYSPVVASVSVTVSNRTVFPTPLPFGKESMYSEFNQGDAASANPAAVANNLLDNVWPARGFPLVHLGWPLTWTEDPYNDAFWRFYQYSLRPESSLLFMWKTTGDRRYLDKLIAILRSYVAYDQIRPENTLTFDNNHAAAYRAMTLTNFYFKLRDAGELPADLDAGLRASLAKLGAFLADPKHFEGGVNHGFNEGAALLLIADNFPDLRDAAAWRQTAIDRLNGMLASTLDTDGVEVENSPFYHVYVLGLVYQIAEWAKLYEPALAPSYSAAEQHMLRYAAYVTQPSGYLPMLGATATTYMPSQDPSIYGPMAASDPEFRFAYTRGAQGTPPPDGVVLFPSSGLFILRSVLGSPANLPQQTYMTFDAGPYRTEHSDLDALGVTMYAAGQTVLPESGLFTYTQQPDRSYFHGTSAHNTVVVDGADQAQGDAHPGPYGNASESSWATGTSDLYAGVHHRRAVVVLRQGLSLIVDQLHSAATHSYTQTWHLDPSRGTRSERPGRVRLLTRRETALDDPPGRSSGRDADRGQGADQPGDGRLVLERVRLQDPQLPAPIHASRSRRAVHHTAHRRCLRHADQHRHRAPRQQRHRSRRLRGRQRRLHDHHPQRRERHADSHGRRLSRRGRVSQRT